MRLLRSRRKEEVADRMRPEDMQSMMAGMMGQMIGGMSLEERTEFMQSMIATCIKGLTEGLGAQDRQRLAGAVLSKMTDELARMR